MKEETTLIETLELIERNGFFNTNSPYELITYEDTEFNDWDDYTNFLHTEIPNDIREICKKVNAQVSIYHLKDDVTMPEFIVLIEKDGKRYTLMLDIVDYGSIDVVIVDGVFGWIEIPVYYHEV